METQKALEYFKSLNREDYEWPAFSDLWFTLVTAVTFLFIEKLSVVMFYPWFYKICKEKNDQEVRHRRTLKASK